MADLNSAVHLVDENGNVNNIYPATKIGNVEGLQTALNAKANSADVTSGLALKVDKETGKGLSTNDYTTAEKNKLAGIEAQANKTVVDSALNSSSTNPLQNKIIYNALNNKVDKIPGKTLTENDFTDDYKALIDNIEMNCITPDDFSGTDTEKLQASMDSLKDTGGTIVISRLYNITADLICKLNTDSALTKKAKIVFIGVGKNATLKVNNCGFISDGTNEAIGGLNFININFEGTGTDTLFNLNKLIRLAFLQCRFYNLKFCFWGNYIIQDIKAHQCYFEKITESVVESLAGLWYVTFSQCTCESSKNFFMHDRNKQVNGLYGAVIRDCCIEGLTGIAVFFTMSKKIVIDGCYFEANENYIDLSASGMSESVTITNNIFIEPSSNKCIIKLPPIQSHINCGEISSNSIEGSAILFDVSLTTDIIRYWIRDNKTGSIFKIANDDSKVHYLNIERNFKHITMEFKDLELVKDEWTPITGNNIINDLPDLRDTTIVSIDLLRFQGKINGGEPTWEIVGDPQLFTDNIWRMKITDTISQHYYAVFSITYCDIYPITPEPDES